MQHQIAMVRRRAVSISRQRIHRLRQHVQRTTIARRLIYIMVQQVGVARVYRHIQNQRQVQMMQTIVI